MAKFKVDMRFRDRKGKDISKYSAEEIEKLPIIETADEYESDDKEWTDYLIGKGFLSPIKEAKAPAKKPPQKRTTPKKASE